MNAVAPSACTDGDDWIAHALGLRANQFLFLHQANAHRVHEWVALVGRVKHHLARDGRDTHAIAVIADAFHHAAHEIPHAWRVERAEAQRVEHRDWASAHREDVAQDATHAGGRALIRLDCGRMVVRFNLEGDGEAVTDRNHAGILARAL